MILSPLLLKSVIRYLLHNPLQAVLAVLGIALGVAVVVAIDLTNHSSKKAFLLSTEQVMGASTHRIEGTSQGVSDALYQKLRKGELGQLNIKAMAPILTAKVRLEGLPGKTVQLLGVDPIAEAPFRTYSSLSATNNALTMHSLGRLISEPNTAWLSQALANLLNLKIDEQINVDINAKLWPLIMVSTFGEASDARFNNLLVVDISTAQFILEKPGFLSHIDLILTKKQAAHLEEVLPDKYILVQSEALKSANSSLTESFYLNLLALSILALAVGMFLIYNTMHFSVLKRLELFARLRVLGVTNREIVYYVLWEALLLGIVGTALGLVLGIILATGLIGFVSQTINDLYYVTTINDFFVDPIIVFKGLALGILTTILASLSPCYLAFNNEIKQMLTRIHQEKNAKSQHLVFAKGSILFLILTLVFVMIEQTGLIGGFFAITCFLFSAALIVPKLLDMVFQMIISKGGSKLSLLGRMVLRDARQYLSRTGIAVMALTIALASSNGIAVMINSFRLTVTDWLEQRVNADIYLRPVTYQLPSEGYFQFAIRDYLIQPQIDSIAYYRGLSVRVNHQSISLVLADIGDRAKKGFNFLKAKPNIWHEFSQGGLLISESFAYKHRYQVGDAVELLTDVGLINFNIVGIYQDYGSEQGRLMLSFAKAQQFWPDPAINAVGIYLGSSVSQAEKNALINELERTVGTQQALEITDNQSILATSLAIFDRTFTVTQVLRLLALLVAFVGIVSAFLALMLERSREFNLWYQLGFTRSEMVKINIYQSTLLGFFAGVIAIPVGWVMAYILIDVINIRAFGWSMQFEPSYSLVLPSVALSVVASMIACLVPVGRLARIHH